MKRVQGMVCAHFVRLVFAVLVVLGASSVATAASQRTFVASYGSDLNPNCNLVLPCRSFNAAIAQTSLGGEVVILDTAGYGPMLINKSIKVIGPSGVYGGISASAVGSDGITINAGDGDIVTLRGLDVTGLGGLHGVNIVNAKAVHIEKSTISGFSDPAGACLRLDTTKNMRVFVNDSFLRDCQIGAVVNGPAASGRPRLMLDNVRIERGTGINTDVGVQATGQTDVGIRNSVITSLGYAVRFQNTLPAVSPNLSIVDTQIFAITNPILVANSGNGTQMQVEIGRSNLKGVGVDVSATNNSRAVVFIEDSTFSSSATAVKTSGTGGSWVEVGLTRSKIHTSTIAVDHGFGQVLLNACDIVWNSNSIVNSGSGDVKALLNNFFYQNLDSTVGFTYVTPSTIAPK